MGRPQGFKHTEETKRRMRENHKGLSRPHTEEEKAKTSKTMKEWHKNNPHPRKGKNASDETKKKMSLARQGSNNGNWKGGLTQIIKGIRRSPEFFQWRKAVLERDNQSCQDCGSSESINTHHIKPILEYPELVFEVSNGLTLCEDCHKRHTSWQRLNRGGK